MLNEKRAFESLANLCLIKLIVLCGETFYLINAIVSHFIDILAIYVLFIKIIYLG